MKIKEIFQSLDFKNNKIFNAKLGSEITHEKHIVDKKYVDDSFVYSTELSQRYKDSITIERINAINFFIFILLKSFIIIVFVISTTKFIEFLPKKIS